MKKALLTLLIVFGTFGHAWAGKVETLVNEYRGNDGFEVVSMGPIGMSLLRMAASLGGDLDQEERAALASFNGIRRITVVDFEGLESRLKKQFCKKMDSILKGMELIMEVKDKADVMRIYGMDEGETIRDCVLYSSDGTLICTRGRLSLDKIGELMQMAE